MGIAKRNWPLYSNDISLVTCIYPYMQLLITFYMKFYMLLYICNISVSDQTKFSLYHTNAHCIYISNIDVANAFYNIIYQKWNDVQLFVLRFHDTYFLFYSVYFYSHIPTPASIFAFWIILRIYFNHFSGIWC